MNDLQQHPHRRFNPLKREWVLVSPQRTQRPWQGAVEANNEAKLAEYEPTCYLCPGNARAGGKTNPNYSDTFVFDNDFPALESSEKSARTAEDSLLTAEAEAGICRVVCFSPRHDLALSGMTEAALRKVVDVWVDQYRDLGALPSINSVQIFENRGAMMGASNPHPHGQIWASSHVPDETLKEVNSFLAYNETHSSCLLCDYLKLELQKEIRVVCVKGDFVAVVPFWAVWPFETLVIGKRHTTGLDQLSEGERDDLAVLLKDLTTMYDRLFKTSFPYTMGFHQRPTDGLEHSSYHAHAHFYPPLLRSATVRKFMVGYELLATPQRDITPEQAAARLREGNET
ncbi:MAG TPA: UDP-glucose--hexose-1-phosphate uridylyltransferase [Pyrinomonadaceae bacterium]|nr:UDP-glucose--hexose-1-phosphate uridylyltransferase [Pyrinomonadaceae bacterium]